MRNAVEINKKNKKVTNVAKLVSDDVEADVPGSPFDEDADGVLEHRQGRAQHDAGEHQRTHGVHDLHK